MQDSNNVYNFCFILFKKTNFREKLTWLIKVWISFNLALTVKFEYSSLYLEIYITGPFLFNVQKCIQHYSNLHYVHFQLDSRLFHCLSDFQCANTAFLLCKKAIWKSKMHDWAFFFNHKFYLHYLQWNIVYCHHKM